MFQWVKDWLSDQTEDSAFPESRQICQIHDPREPHERSFPIMQSASLVLKGAKARQH
jgi:hypothetical protein